MLTRYEDFDRSFATMERLRRRMDRLFDETEAGREGRTVERMWSGGYPRFAFADTGATLELEAELPGIADKGVELTIHKDVLTMSGERKPDAPQGYVVHRQERAPVRFSRSFALPCKVDPEKSVATIKNGVLVVSLAKATEATPRQIAVKVQ
jgi:HSP20 family protein